RSRHTRWPRDWSSDVCSSDLGRRERQSLRTGWCDRDGRCDTRRLRLFVRTQFTAWGGHSGLLFYSISATRNAVNFGTTCGPDTRSNLSGIWIGSGQCSWILTARLSGGDVGGSDRLRLVGYATPGAVGLESGFGCNLNQATTLSQSTKTRSCGTFKKTKFIASRM